MKGHHVEWRIENGIMPNNGVEVAGVVLKTKPLRNRTSDGTPTIVGIRLNIGGWQKMINRLFRSMSASRNFSARHVISMGKSGRRAAP